MFPFKFQKLAGRCSGNDCNLNQTCVPIEKDYYCVPLPINISESKFVISWHTCFLLHICLFL